MTSIREQQRSDTTPLTDSPAPALPDPDFAELDAMLEAAPKPRSAQIHKDKLKVFQQLCHTLTEYELTEALVVWRRATCHCGYRSEPLFVRYMEKWERAGGKVINWKTVEELDKRLEEGQINDAIIEREVCWCGKCARIEGKVKDFNSYVKGGKKDAKHGE